MVGGFRSGNDVQPVRTAVGRLPCRLVSGSGSEGEAGRSISAEDTAHDDTAANESGEQKKPRKRTQAPEARRLEPREWLKNPATFSWDPGEDGWLPAEKHDSLAARATALHCHVVARAVRSAKAASGVTDADLITDTSWTSVRRPAASGTCVNWS